MLEPGIAVLEGLYVAELMTESTPLECCPSYGS